MIKINKKNYKILDYSDPFKEKDFFILIIYTLELL